MAFFGPDKPIFTVDGEVLSLPTPTDRQEFPEYIANQYIGVNDNLIVRKKGWRFRLNLIYNRPSSATLDDLIQIANATTITVQIGSIPVAYPVLVTKFLGEMDTYIENNVIEFEVKNIDLINSVPSEDDHWTIRKIGNGAIYLSEPN